MSKIFAHRGFSSKYPENTMLAFKKAIEIGVDGIELDVQLTKDGVPVIIHDETLERTTDGQGNIIDFTYDEISKLDASYKFKNLNIVNKIPTLNEYFDFVKDYNIVTNLELKTSVIEYFGIEEKVFELIKKYKLENNIIISSFNHYSVLRFKKLAPNIKCGFLTESWLIDAGKYTQKNRVECYHPYFKNLTPEVIKELKSSNIEINTWTVNKKRDMEYLIKQNIDVIITNHPDLLKDILSSI
ncbi:glycerophosphodiester phosphodiesterase [Fusobacterium sp.]|uniref:glycerophosphodiester phosphodiesterase n=1 Tax=Fusobacterium sp. TaxID=68766 RepID=UPI0025C287B2|nr:glycerophosphodiester phosphodiesterase [Fusobacterium sp.]